MIADTIVVVFMCIMPTHKPKEVKENRFTEVFEQADKAFDKKYKVDIEALKKASYEAVKSAEGKTLKDKIKAINSLVIFKDGGDYEIR